MGFRFSKRISILPGVRVNLSRSGPSLSLGPRGASVNVGKRGVYGNVGIPGTGLSYRERLDKPAARSPRTTPAALPDRVTARIHEDEIQFLGDNEEPLDDRFIPEAKRLMKEDLRDLLERGAAVRNESFEALRELHHDIPTSFRRLETAVQGKPDKQEFASHEAYMQALMTWRAECANAGIDSGVIEGAVLQALGDLAWPRETNIAIDLQGTRLLLDVDLPEIEDMPAERCVPSISKLRLVEKPLSQKGRAALYLDHISSLLFRIIGHAMAVSDEIGTVAISAYTQRESTTGRPDDEYVATVEVTRSMWNSIDLSQLTDIDPHNALRRFAAKLETNSRGILLVQQPLA